MTTTNQWFEATAKYEKVQADGTNKKVSEKYLVEGLNFTEAEARSIEEITPFMNGDFEVDLKRKKFAEVFTVNTDAADKFYKIKLAFITLDEKTQAEKESVFTYLLQAEDFDAAHKSIKNEMSNTYLDYKIVLIQETSILDVYRYVAKTDTSADTPE